MDWKVAHNEVLSAIVRMCRNEHNAVLRQRITEAWIRTQAPMIAAIIRQGCEEGVFDATYPDEAATMIAGMELHLGDLLVDAFTDTANRADVRDRREVLIRAHLEALERILAAEPGMLAQVAVTMIEIPPFTA
ncbi:hypothetical protein [Nocardia gipuzkoensis]